MNDALKEPSERRDRVSSHRFLLSLHHILPLSPLKLAMGVLDVVPVRDLQKRDWGSTGINLQSGRRFDWR